jgi:hypothetical protein
MFGSQGSLNEAYSHFCNLVNWDPPHTQAHRFINRVSDFIDFLEKLPVQIKQETCTIYRAFFMYLKMRHVTLIWLF